MPVNVLGIETSCDETAAAVVKDGSQMLSNIVATQIDIHKVFGGVVPEVAARNHIEVMLPVIDEALEQAFEGVEDKWAQIDAIAVTKGPGLSGALLIGTITARTLALVKNKPLYGMNHVLAHVYANFISPPGGMKLDDRRQTTDDRISAFKSATADSRRQNGRSEVGRQTTDDRVSDKELGSSVSPASTVCNLPSTNYPFDTSNEWIVPEFPLLVLIVSGGHTQLVLFRGHYDYELLGQTQDDAVGEAFDKVAKVLGLGYPGGPSIQKSAEAGGNPSKYKFPKAKLSNRFNFSFSGLKTAVLRQTQLICDRDHSFPSFELAALLSDKQVKDVAASFQRVAIETLVDKTMEAYDEFLPDTVVIAGGVAANTELRRQLKQRLPIDINYAPTNLCTDNAAMIASLGYFHSRQIEADNPHHMEINTSLSM